MPLIWFVIDFGGSWELFSFPAKDEAVLFGIENLLPVLLIELAKDPPLLA